MRAEYIKVWAYGVNCAYKFQQLDQKKSHWAEISSSLFVIKLLLRKKWKMMYGVDAVNAKANN